MVLTGTNYSQYSLKSRYLVNPDLNHGFVDSCATFWLNSFDENLGGFYTNVDRQGNVITQWGTNKNMLTQTRNAYGLTRAFMMTGNELYLEKAKEALEFMYSSSWDDVFGGWFGEADKNGNPVNLGSNRTAFNHHYALLGILAYFEATGDTSTWNWFQKGFEHNEQFLWDNDENFFGYFDYGNYNWNTLNNKSFNATVDAVTTHLINAYLLTGDDIYKDRLLTVADNIVTRLTPTMDQYKIGFVEKYNTDWTWNDNTANDNTRTIMGHVLKTGWVLGRIHEVLPNEEYLEAAEKLVLHVWENGYDHKYGGPYKDYDRVTGNMLFYGQDTAKAWWQMEQAIVSGLQLYHLTENELYLEMADESSDFFMEYFVDHTYGEVYENRFKDGSFISAWGSAKGGGGKAGYHSIETGYYTYLYSNLFYHLAPITLYYMIESVDFAREIKLEPLAFNENLVIRNIELDQSEFTSFSSADNKLILESGIGGKFKVVFEVDNAVSVTQNEILPTKIELNQNYPNPFNPATIIQYSIPVAALSEVEVPKVTLKVFDILGREIVTLVNKEQAAGNYEVQFDGSELNSGVYFYVLQSGINKISKKMLLLK